MDFSSPIVTYVFLVIPILFAGSVLAQGIQKLSQQEPDGPIVVGFGVVFFLLIIGAYVFFIQ